MGMAASQVRLLALTDRLHDVELKAQQILAQKLALGTQKDALYNEYCDKLEATNYMVAFRDNANYGNARYVDATFENLCTYLPDRMRQYALTNTVSGKTLVTQDEKDIYDQYNNDKYAYAMAMMGLEDGFGSAAGASGQNNPGKVVGLNTGNNIGTSTYLNAGNIINPNTTGPLTEDERDMLDSLLGTNDNYVNSINEYDNATDEDKSTLAANIRTEFSKLMPKNIMGDGNDVLMTEAELVAFMNADQNTRESLQGYIDAIYSDDCKDQDLAFQSFRDALYTKLGPQIHDAMYYLQNGEDPTEADAFDKGEFNFYVNRWTAINETGGCEVVDARYESGEDAREWLENMVKAGLITIQECVNGDWMDTSVATSTNGNFLIEQDDEKGLKQAEAEYEHEMDIIDRKETKMDNELAKLETERKAITTEMDSIKTVKDDNIDRTFGIFG